MAAAGYDRLREPGAAEVAFAVADDFRSRGAATRLLEQLAQIAAERGIRRFDAEVLAGNRAMLGVFRRAGFALRRRGSFGELTVSLDIRPSAEVLERIDERDHLAALASVRTLLAPRSMAILGASAEAGNPGAEVLAAVLAGDFCGVVTPVHPGGDVVGSVRAAPAVAALGEPPELVVVTDDSEASLGSAREALDAGAKALLVLGSDHRREDAAGLGERWLELARSAGTRVLGPNSLGVINTDPGVRLFATRARSPVTPGRLAICSQSGAIGIGLLGHAAARRLGISTFVSLGDRVDVSTNDLLEFWEEDERTAAVMLYVETFGNPERFARIARRVSRRKPILAVRGQLSAPIPQGDAASHTAAALRGDAAVDALLRHAGVMRFRSGEELLGAAEYFESQPLPGGNRVGIVSNSAGIATLAQDACATRGLVLGEVGRGGEELERAAEPPGDVVNPWIMSISVGAESYRGAVRGLLADPGIDAVLAYYVDPGAGDAAAVLRAVDAAAHDAGKPVVAGVLGSDGRPTCLPEVGVPNFPFPESCAAVIARGVERRAWLSRPLGQAREFAGADPEAARAVVEPWLDALTGDATRWPTLPQAEELLASYALPLTPSQSCESVEEAVGAAGMLGVPIALKADFPPPAHAGDIDAVLLGLHGEGAVRHGWQELERRVQAAGRAWSGALVQPLVEPGADILLGTVRDSALGPLLALGLGGRQAGLLSTAAFRLLPVTDVDADELIAASDAVAAQLEGFRGAPALDHEALRDLVLRFADLIRTVPEILEADLNPVRVMTSGVTVLDLRLRIGRPPRPRRVKTW